MLALSIRWHQPHAGSHNLLQEAAVLPAPFRAAWQDPTRRGSQPTRAPCFSPQRSLAATREDLTFWKEHYTTLKAELTRMTTAHTELENSFHVLQSELQVSWIPPETASAGVPWSKSLCSKASCAEHSGHTRNSFRPWPESHARGLPTVWCRGRADARALLARSEWMRRRSSWAMPCAACRASTPSCTGEPAPCATTTMRRLSSSAPSKVSDCSLNVLQASAR